MGTETRLEDRLAQDPIKGPGKVYTTDKGLFLPDFGRRRRYIEWRPGFQSFFGWPDTDQTLLTLCHGQCEATRCGFGYTVCLWFGQCRAQHHLRYLLLWRLSTCLPIPYRPNSLLRIVPVTDIMQQSRMGQAIGQRHIQKRRPLFPR